MKKKWRRWNRVRANEIKKRTLNNDREIICYEIGSPVSIARRWSWDLKSARTYGSSGNEKVSLGVGKKENRRVVAINKIARVRPPHWKGATWWTSGQFAAREPPPRIKWHQKSYVSIINSNCAASNGLLGFAWRRLAPVFNHVQALFGRLPLLLPNDDMCVQLLSHSTHFFSLLF